MLKGTARMKFAERQGFVHKHIKCSTVYSQDDKSPQTPKSSSYFRHSDSLGVVT